MLSSAWKHMLPTAYFELFPQRGDLTLLRLRLTFFGWFKIHFYKDFYAIWKAFLQINMIMDPPIPLRPKWIRRTAGQSLSAANQSIQWALILWRETYFWYGPPKKLLQTFKEIAGQIILWEGSNWKKLLPYYDMEDFSKWLLKKHENV